MQLSSNSPSFCGRLATTEGNQCSGIWCTAHLALLNSAVRGGRWVPRRARVGTGLGTQQVDITNTRHGRPGACSGDPRKVLASRSFRCRQRENLSLSVLSLVSIFAYSKSCIPGFNRHSKICCTYCLDHVSIPLPRNTFLRPPDRP